MCWGIYPSIGVRAGAAVALLEVGPAPGPVQRGGPGVPQGRPYPGCGTSAASAASPRAQPEHNPGTAGGRAEGKAGSRRGLAPPRSRRGPPCAGAAAPAQPRSAAAGGAGPVRAGGRGGCSEGGKAGGVARPGAARDWRAAAGPGATGRAGPSGRRGASGPQRAQRCIPAAARSAQRPRGSFSPFSSPMSPGAGEPCERKARPERWRGGGNGDGALRAAGGDRPGRASHRTERKQRDCTASLLLWEGKRGPGCGFPASRIPGRNVAGEQKEEQSSAPEVRAALRGRLTPRDSAGRKELLLPPCVRFAVEFIWCCCTSCVMKRSRGNVLFKFYFVALFSCVSAVIKNKCRESAKK